MWGSNDGVCLFEVSLVVFLNKLGCRKVYQLQIPVLIDHKVLRLDIPADNAFLCKIFQDQYYGSRVKLAILG